MMEELGFLNLPTVGDRAHLVFQELIIWAEKEAPDMILGVGSIVDAGTTSIYIQLGASFIVSPVLNPDMAKVCNRRKNSLVAGLWFFIRDFTSRGAGR